jgi:hypothetical protein
VGHSSSLCIYLLIKMMSEQFLLQSQHMRHHDVVTLGDVSSSDSTFGLFSGLTVCCAPAVTAGGC